VSNSFGFDFTGIDSSSEGKSSTLPVGEYTVIIDRAEMTQTKSGTGYYVKVGMKVCDMEKYNGAFLWDNINIKNDSAKAQEIGRGKLKKMLEIIGIEESKMKDTDPSVLVGKKYRVFTTVTKNKEYGDSNKICSYSEVEGQIVNGIGQTAAAKPTPSWS